MLVREYSASFTFARQRYYLVLSTRGYTIESLINNHRLHSSCNRSIDRAPTLRGQLSKTKERQLISKLCNCTLYDKICTQLSAVSLRNRYVKNLTPHYTSHCNLRVRTTAVCSLRFLPLGLPKDFMALIPIPA